MSQQKNPGPSIILSVVLITFNKHNEIMNTHYMQSQCRCTQLMQM